MREIEPRRVLHLGAFGDKPGQRRAARARAGDHPADDLRLGQRVIGRHRVGVDDLAQRALALDDVERARARAVGRPAGRGGLDQRFLDLAHHEQGLAVELGLAEHLRLDDAVEVAARAIGRPHAERRPALGLDQVAQAGKHTLEPWVAHVLQVLVDQRLRRRGVDARRVAGALDRLAEAGLLRPDAGILVVDLLGDGADALAELVGRHGGARQQFLLELPDRHLAVLDLALGDADHVLRLADIEPGLLVGGLEHPGALA